MPVGEFTVHIIANADHARLILISSLLSTGNLENTRSDICQANYLQSLVVFRTALPAPSN